MALSLRLLRRPALIPLYSLIPLNKPSLRPQSVSEFPSPFVNRRSLSAASAPPFSLPELDKGRAFANEGQHTKALAQFSRGFDIAKQIFPTDSLELCRIREAMAQIHWKTGDLSQLSKVLDALKASYSKLGRFGDLVRTQRNAIVALQMRQSFDPAIAASHALLATIGSQSEETAEANSNLAALTIDALLFAAMNTAFKGAIEQTTPLLQQCSAIVDEEIPAGHFVRARVLYAAALLQHIARGRFDSAKELLTEARRVLESNPKPTETKEGSANPAKANGVSARSEREQLLLSQIYDSLAQVAISEGDNGLAEELGKKSLDITNKFCDRNSKRVEWTLHLMAQALINAKKYLYAEGLLRRLLAMVSAESGKGFEIQLHSLESYHAIMAKFNRLGEAGEVRGAIDRLKESGFRRDIEFAAYFDQCEFVTQ